jgi:hypothetical protein
MQAAMDNAAGRIESRLQLVETHHSPHCFGKMPMQTFRCVPHVADERSRCEHAQGEQPT